MELKPEMRRYLCARPHFAGVPEPCDDADDDDPLYVSIETRIRRLDESCLQKIDVLGFVEMERDRRVFAGRLSALRRAGPHRPWDFNLEIATNFDDESGAAGEVACHAVTAGQRLLAAAARQSACLSSLIVLVRLTVALAYRGFGLGLMAASCEARP